MVRCFSDKLRKFEPSITVSSGLRFVTPRGHRSAGVPANFMFFHCPKPVSVVSLFAIKTESPVAIVDVKQQIDESIQNTPLKSSKHRFAFCFDLTTKTIALQSSRWIDADFKKNPDCGHRYGKVFCSSFHILPLNSSLTMQCFLLFYVVWEVTSQKFCALKRTEPGQTVFSLQVIVGMEKDHPNQLSYCVVVAPASLQEAATRKITKEESTS